MSFKYLRKIPVIRPNIFSRNYKDLQTPFTIVTQRHSQDWATCRVKFGTSSTTPNLAMVPSLNPHKDRILPNIALWNLRRNSDPDILKNYRTGSTANLKLVRSTVTCKTGLKYRKYMQTRNYSSLIDKILNFFKSYSSKPQKPVEQETKTYEKPCEIKPLETLEFQTVVQEKPAEVKKDFKEQIKDMKEFSEEFEVESEAKKSLSGEGKFAEDRLCKEMPEKLHEKAEQDKAKVKTIASKKKMQRGPKCQKDDTFAGCKLDDTYSGVAPDDDNKIILTFRCEKAPKKLKKSKCKPEYVVDDAGCKDDVSEEIINKKEEQCVKSIKVDVTPKKCKKSSLPADKPPKKKLFESNSASKAQKRDRHFRKIASDFAASYAPSYDLARLLDEAMRIKKDPTITIEKKDPRSTVEFKDPEKIHSIKEPDKSDDIREPTEIFEVLAQDDSKDGCEYTKFPQEKNSKCADQKKKEEKKCEKAEVKREEKECPPPKAACPRKKEKICEVEAPKATEPCESQQGCCYKKKQKMPAIECTVCKKFEILDIPPKPKPKASPCKAKKCGKEQKKCVDAKAPPPNCCKPLPKRPPPCPKCPKPKFPAEPKAVPPKPVSLSCDNKCMQKKCERKMPCCRPVCVKTAPPKQPEPEPPRAPEPPKAAAKPTTSKKDLEKTKAKLEKMCKKKKKKSKECSVNTCKAKDACVKRKEKRAKDQADRDKPVAKKDSCKVGVHTDWKPVAITSGKKKCKPAPPQSSNVRPDTDPKYQSPRFDKNKPKCDKGNSGKLANRSTVDEITCPGWHDGCAREFIKTQPTQSAPAIFCLPRQSSGFENGNDGPNRSKPYAFYMDSDFPDRDKKNVK